MSTMDAAAPPAGKAQLLRSRDDLKEWVAQAVGVCAEEFDETTSLIELGLDSINMMRLPVVLKRQGVEISVRNLIQNPTVEQWWSLIEKTSGLAHRSTPPAPCCRTAIDFR